MRSRPCGSVALTRLWRPVQVRTVRSFGVAPPGRVCTACRRRLDPQAAAGQTRWAATATATPTRETVDHSGPMREYDKRVEQGLIQDDEHQRGIIQSLQHLHDELRHHQPKAVVRPTLESLTPSRSLLGSLFGRAPKNGGRLAIPDDLPRGLYLYGDVGSGKTMMMNLFFDTLPASIAAKTRIHFHHFMQDVHRRMHGAKVALAHTDGVDVVPFVAADLAAQASVLCLDEFQCTDVADAMILRRLLEALMAHGVVLVTTSNRPPDHLYQNGVQRESFLPAIALLKARLHVINLDSPTDYRRLPRPPSGVYHTPLDAHAASHALKWFRFLGDPAQPAPHPETQQVWGRELVVPRVSGRCAWFTFAELMGAPAGPADYLELMRSYDAFVVTAVPAMTLRDRDLARRFITFVDAVYESHAKLVLTTARPLPELFVSRQEMDEALAARGGALAAAAADHDAAEAERLARSSLFSGDEEAFAFARALSRLAEMGSQEWVERGMGLESQGGKPDHDGWKKVRSRRMEDSM